MTMLNKIISDLKLEGNRSHIILPANWIGYSLMALQGLLNLLMASILILYLSILAEGYQQKQWSSSMISYYIPISSLNTLVMTPSGPKWH